MNKSQFWEIIDETLRSMQGHDQETYFCRIVEALLHHEKDDIMDWQQIMNEYSRAAYRSDLWKKSLELGIHSEENGFLSFRLWLISRGKDAYLGALKNPQTVETLIQNCGDPHFERLDYAAYYAFEAKLFLVGSMQQEDLFTAMAFHSLNEEILWDIQADIPPLVPEQTRPGQDIEKLLNSDRLMYGYVYEKGKNSKYLVEDSPENVANFLGSHLSAERILLTDILDRFVLDTFGGFINRCSDQTLLSEIKKTLTPIQTGETEAKPALCATADEVEMYYENQKEKKPEMTFQGFKR